MSSRTRLCVPIVDADTPLPDQVRAARDAGADVVELRVDLIGDADAVLELLRGPRLLEMIATVRSAQEGGAWQGSEAERIALIERLGMERPGYIDLEYRTWQRSANLRQKIALVCDLERADAPDERASAARVHPADSATRRPRNKLILSYHDFQRTPADLAAIMDALAATPAYAVKLATMARDASDAVRVLRELHRFAGRRRVIALAMGAAGEATRVLAPCFGAYLTFAASQPGRGSAPGQTTIQTLRRDFGWDAIEPGASVLGVVGWPVEHSQGPALHNAAMRAAGINGVYVRLPVAPTYDDFARFMEGLDAAPELHVRGLSVTLPHKEHALRWIDAHACLCSDTAHRCGAVNTLTRGADGTWRADNTDAAGVLKALASAGLLRSDMRIAVLGAGGVARAVVAALRGHAESITIYNRSSARAAALAAQFSCGIAPWEERAAHGADLLVNCTSVGMWPAVEESPLSDHALTEGLAVFDTVYRPAQTRLLREAQSRGCRTVGGTEMFLHQAAAQFEQWHGQAAPLDVMRAAMAQRPRVP